MNTLLDSFATHRKTAPRAFRPRMFVFSALLAATLMLPALMPASAQEGNGSSLFATEGKKSKEGKSEKDKEAKEEKKEEKKAEKQEQRAQKQRQLGLEAAENGPEPNPEMPADPAADEMDADAVPPLEDAEPAVEETTPPQPRVTVPSRPNASPSAAVLPPPESDQKGVLQEPPPAAPLPVNENRPKNGSLEGRSEFYLDFQAQKLSEVIAAIGPMVGKNFLLDQTVGEQPVTLITHAAIPADMVMPIFEAVLNTYNFKLVETADGNLMKIVPLDQGKEQAPLIMDQGVVPEGFENYQIGRAHV